MSDAGEVSLDLEDILAEARARTGLDDFGDEDFVAPLRVLLDSLDREARLHAEGRAGQRARIVDSLATRLSAQACFREHPEILEEPIQEPLFVIALPRSGTTLLHRILAADPRAQAVLWWECRSPAPWPGTDWERGDDPRIADARAQVEQILAARPELAAIHPWDPEGPDEEILLLEHSFFSHVPESGARIPAYNAWLDRQDMAPAYAYLKKLLQLLQWQKRRSGRGGEHWVLKAPFHLGFLDTLFATFPDARIVQAHRDPLETLPSIASMYASLWRLASDEVDEHEIGRHCLARYSRSLARCLEARERLPAERFLDIGYHDLLSNPMAQMRTIYDFLGRHLDTETDMAMRQELALQARDRRDAHDYSLERFGFREDEIAEAFAHYRERFIGAGRLTRRRS